MTEAELYKLREALRELRGASNTPTMSAMADVIYMAVKLDIVDWT